PAAPRAPRRVSNRDDSVEQSKQCPLGSSRDDQVLPAAASRRTARGDAVHEANAVVVRGDWYGPLAASRKAAMSAGEHEQPRGSEPTLEQRFDDALAAPPSEPRRDTAGDEAR